MIASTGRSSWNSMLRPSARTPALIGYGAVLLMGGTLGLWAASVPISGAAVAAGTIAAAGRNIQMQHLEGGIVRSISIREGDVVRRGDTIMVLDDTAARTQLNRLAKQWLSLCIRIERLGAERDGASELVDTHCGKRLPISVDPSEIILEEEKEFNARLARFRSEQTILEERLDQLNETLSGLGERRAAVQKQAEVVKDELQRKQSLVARGLINRSDYTELLRIDADLLGQTAAVASEQATTGSQIAEAKEQVERLRTQRTEEAVTKLNESKNSLRDVEEQLAASFAVLERTVIKAPSDGIVVTSAYNIVGNVIGPGEKIMEILPTADRPLVEARLQPKDIDVVHSGQHARLRFTALDARRTPEVEAVVQQVSADRLVDQTTQQPYYRALLEITESLPTDVSKDDLHPGMPVEVFISTGDRTFFDYLIKPLLDSTSHAFVED
ncbi:HlyD family type I secretion periplasmic adaptor subunit [Rhizobium leguminosarum]|uniref:HlyD family type I secretion periplasmic adaptor subunit n=1 Tax=Rhizobium leguminosarum TaxID=384 RepID=UPI001A92583D|nr:HlyD family type I secretion periplasmic adaptor subunit [Rhizobium leguminosarum]MBY5558860.1 HlyD family type I secretion periplasmic adaptor subunit [Rhizobium leguminosarum]MBY5727960.1 HlyD family type I secretion periplasmic adaptor subunit [Rhizobium leguminosarum]QSW27012.1 HlyD family type I secretion periplasmic adaptor subunit [Rhizobium leguminosarum]